jgi:cobalt-zinc-cadmium efflux system outer membrane protein
LSDFRRSAAAAAIATFTLIGAAHGQQQAAVSDLTLAEAQRLLVEGNRQIRLASRALNIASSEIRRADVAPNPTVGALVYNTTAGQYRYGESDRTLRIEQMFERGNKRSLRVATAREAERAARYDVADTTRQQRLVMTQAYYDLVASQYVARIALDNVAGYQRLVEAADRRLRAGDIAAVDVSRLRVEASRAANEARAAQGAVDGARIALAALLGAEARAQELRAIDDFPALDSMQATAEHSPASPDRIEAALGRRPDARAAIARIAALEKARDLALSQRTRDVTIGVQAENAPAYQGTVFGVSASFPLFVNNDYSGDIARAQADIAQAGEELERIRGAIRADIERAGAQLRSAHDRARRVATEALPEARRAAEAIEFAFGRGAATLTDLFDARRQLAAVRIDAIAAHAEFAKAQTAWTEALATVEEIP